MNFYAVIVIYNKYVGESISFRSLINLSLSNLHFLIIDNSSSEYICENKYMCDEMKIQYYSMDGNAGLSKAYNYALQILDKKNDDIVIWFDDDTHINRKYFDILSQYCSDKELDVFAPIVYGQNGVIYSPCERGLLKGRYIKNPNQLIKKDKFNAINSCLAVRLRVYKNYRYDEKLFMDCVDTKLFDDFRKMDLNFCVLPIEIHQNFFQRMKQQNIEKYWLRFKIRIKDTFIYYSHKGKIERIAGSIKVIGWAIMYGFKLKSFTFFKNCIMWMLDCFMEINRENYEG